MSDIFFIPSDLKAALEIKFILLLFFLLVCSWHGTRREKDPWLLARMTEKSASMMSSQTSRWLLMSLYSTSVKYSYELKRGARVVIRFGHQSGAKKIAILEKLKKFPAD